MTERLQLIHSEEPAANTQSRPALQSAGGGDNSDGMLEARVAKLEADVGHILVGVSDLKTTTTQLSTQMTEARISIARVESDLKHKPGYGAIFAVTMGALSFLTALTIFQDRIQHFVGLRP